MLTTLPERFLRGMESSAEKTALRVGESTLSYIQLHRRALAAAAALRAQGSPATVGVLAGRSPESYVGVLAAFYAGAAVVPLNPEYPAALLHKMLDVASTAVLIVDDRGREVLPQLLALGSALTVVNAGIDADIDAGVSDNAEIGAPVLPELDDIAFVFFTSGSTGTPKAVPLAHRSFAWHFQYLDSRCDFGSRDVFAQLFDLNFDCGIQVAFSAWGAGGIVQVVPPAANVDMPGFLKDNGVTVWYSTPSAVWMAREMGGLTDGALSELRWSFFSGETLLAHDAADWCRAAPNSIIANLYGPTELNVVAWHVWGVGESLHPGAHGSVPIGTIVDGHEHILIDREGRQSSIEGELWMRGPQMAAGYLDPTHDDGRFVHREGARWYRTGDWLQDIEGQLSFVSRIDSQVKIRGWRVELAELDDAVRRCPAVREAVTVVLAGRYGNEPVVFYTGESSPSHELERVVKNYVPEAVVPRVYLYLDRLPLNANGKVDRLELTRRAASIGARSGVAPEKEKGRGSHE
jgi:amino acid adenylation domain-containing protein